jgi:uncharacterized membrane protein
LKPFLSTWWERLRSSYWLVPSVLALLAVAGSALSLHIDTRINPKWARDSAWIWAGGADGARSMLATIASSTITVAGVVFSITIVTLTLASSQFGPRLLRNFMSDRGTQLVLGVFVATFLYCLLVLRAVRGTDDLTIVPYFSVTCGVGLAVASVGFLIFFIHHISTSIIAENVIARVASDLRSNIDRLFPEGDPAESTNSEPAESQIDGRDHLSIASRQSGFIQAIAIGRLVELAQQHDLILRVLRKPGDFIAEGAGLAEIVSASQTKRELIGLVRQQFFIGAARNPTQDIEFSIDQLVEVAVRALSPSVNDPFTALSCVEWLGAGLLRLAGRKFPACWHADQSGEVRVMSRRVDFSSVAHACFDRIRQYGSSSTLVVVGVLDMLARIGPHLQREEDRQTLLRIALSIRGDGLSAALNHEDRETIQSQSERTCLALAPAPRTRPSPS